MDAEPDAFEQKLAELAEEFRRSLLTTRTEIEDMWSKALGGAATARAHLLVLVHRVAGSSASFGFPEVAEAAEDLERRIRNSEDIALHVEAMDKLDRRLRDVGGRRN